MEDELRATFDALHAQDRPARTFEAADIIRQGTKERRVHRTWAVLGTGLATAAAVVTALLLLPNNEQKLPSDTVQPAKPTATTPELTPTTQPPTSQPVPTSVETNSTPPSSSASAPDTTR